jgi:hypothetical protein
MLPIKFYHLTRFSGTHSEHGPSARQRADLASELARAVHGNESFDGSRRAHYLEFARDNHKEGRGAISLLVEYLTTLYRTGETVLGNATNLFLC